ncbi:MAG: UDP-N-acetylmuramate--L-alanine ligase [Actinomycetota bacterium]
MSSHAYATDDLSSVHLIGLGGAGMSALARVLVAQGSRVSGSDLKETRGLAALRALGVIAHVGHKPANLEGARVVVVSSAIPSHNPEIVAARNAGIPVLQRAQVLAMLMRDRKSIAVAGTHGKTTTTSMIATVLRHAGLDPTFLIGGDLNETGTNAHAGSGEWLVAEADESDGSLLWLAPDIAIVTNIEADHLDYYANEDEIRQTFRAFVSHLRSGGVAIVCADDPGARELAGQESLTVVTYGFSPDANWSARVIERRPSGVHAQVQHEGKTYDLRLEISGDHNVRNALAAMAAAHVAGVDPIVSARELGQFGGVARRFELRGRAAGVTVVDDYAHHPTEIRATLASARERGWNRIIAVFQPHRYSRTKAMARELGAALGAADAAVVTDVYSAGEHPIPGVSGKSVIDGMLESSPSIHAAYIPARSEIADYVARRAHEGDLVITLGAGDITMIAGEILDLLSTR